MAELRYSPGLDDGVLIAGGSSFVVVRGQLEADHVQRIWNALLEERPLAQVLDVVTRGRLGELPDFVVAVPNAASGGLRIIQRPGLDVTTSDAEGSTHVHSAAGSALWSEHTTPADSSVVVDLTGASGSAGSFPLASGAAMVTLVRWSPDTLGSGATVTPMVDGVATPASVGAPSAVTVVDVVAEASSPSDVPDGFTVIGGYTITGDDLGDDDVVASQEPVAVERPVEAPAESDAEVDPYDSLFGATMYRSVESAAVRPDSETSRESDVAAPAEPTEVVEAAPVVPAAVPERPPLAPSTGMIDSVPVAGVPSVASPASTQPPGDHDGYTVTAASLRELRRNEAAAGEVGAALAASPTPVVHAIACGAGHPNPPQSGTCRVCGSPLPFQDPITVPRPPLGVLVFAGGREVTLDRFVLIGRSPAVERVAPGDLPHLVKLDSPSKDLSRNHVEIRLEGWHVLVVDLQSTNGTVVQLPGRPPERVHPLEPYAIVPGTVITIGDEQSFVYEVRG